MEEDRFPLDFLSGFSYSHGTKLGSKFENSAFEFEFKRARYNGRENVTSLGFETLYDWTNVANILLKKLDNFQEIKTFEAVAQESLHSWFKTYPAWGLLMTLLPKTLQKMYMKTLRMIKETWPLNSEEECTDEKCWNLILQRSLKDLIPDCRVKITEINNWQSHFAYTGRKKNLSIEFSSKYNLEINFTIEKKEMDINLVNLAAENVVKCIRNDEKTDTAFVDALEIPFTLKKPVIDKLQDFKWIQPLDNLMFA